MAYTNDEQAFINYWEKQRLRSKRLVRRSLISFPLGIIIVISIFVNFFSGWHKRASMEANASPGLIIVLLIAGMLIVAFVAIFSSYHKWDINETRYKELMNRENEEQFN